MKVYLCGQFGRMLEFREYAEQIREGGDEVTSSWLLESPDSVEKKLTISTRTRIALKDLQDIDDCDTLICFTEEENGPSRGGRHVEYGYAWAKGKHIIVVGPLENIFTCLSHLRYDTWEEACNSRYLSHSWM